MVLIKKYIKDLILLFIILFFWLISSFIFKYNPEFYNMLSLPNFTLPNNVISIVWFVIYILISISVLIVLKNTNIFKNHDYLYILITNYLSNQLFMYFFFYLMSPFLGFAINTICMLSSIFLFIETKKISKTASYFLIPYVLFSIYAFILMTFIYFMNF